VSGEIFGGSSLSTVIGSAVSVRELARLGSGLAVFGYSRLASFVL
jgi:hypothetical protein